MERKYNPHSIFRKSADSPESQAAAKTSYIIPRPVGIVSLLKEAPVSESDLVSKTTSPKTELADPAEKPLKGEAWDTYVARLAKDGKTPAYRMLGSEVSQRPDLVGGTWDLFRSAHERTVSSPAGAAAPKSPETKADDKK